MLLEIQGQERERERVREVHDMIVRFGGKLGWQHDFLGGPGMVGMCRGPHIGRVLQTTLFEHGIKRCERKRLSQRCTSSHAWEREEISMIYRHKKNTQDSK